MILTMLKAKLHRATVTRADLDYEGSITIDLDLLERSGILPHEQVDVLDIINGAAAHLVKPGDLVIVCAYAQMDAQEARSFKPVILLLDEKNRVKPNTAIDAA